MPLSPDCHLALSEAQTTALIVLTLDLHIVYINPSAQLWMGVSAKSADGSPLGRHIHPIPPLLTNLHKLFKNNHAFTQREQPIEITHTNLKAKIDYTASLISIDGNDHLLLEITPIDNYVKMNEESQLQTNYAAANSLLRGMAHEIKNPLGGIRGAAQLLEREPNPHTIRDYTSIIVEETDRLKHLVDRLLYNQTIQAKQPLNVHKLLERTRQLLTTEFTEIKWLCDYDPSLPNILGYHDPLIQVFINIALNALEAMSAVSTLNPHLTVKTRASREATWLHKQNRLALEISFTDNGPGIPKELKNTLFFPMVSNKPQGTGLGLSTAMSIIEKHEGIIRVDSTENLTQIRVLLPLSKQTAS